MDGQVVMYADSITSSMESAIGETNRRRTRQLEYNTKHGIDPQTIRKRITDILELVASEAPAVERRKGPQVHRDIIDLTGDDLARVILSLEEEMRQAAAELRFEIRRPPPRRSSRIEERTPPTLPNPGLIRSGGAFGWGYL